MQRKVPKKYKNLYEKAMKGSSRRAAMKSFCAECVGYVSKEIEKCTDVGCPLYPYRLK